MREIKKLAQSTHLVSGRVRTWILVYVTPKLIDLSTLLLGRVSLQSVLLKVIFGTGRWTFTQKKGALFRSEKLLRQSSLVTQGAVRPTPIITGGV